MTTVQKIKLAIQSLSPDEFTYLRTWMIALDWENWDKEIEEDSYSGKLDFLIDEALTEKVHNQH